MPEYTVLFHIKTWHREGGSHYVQSSDMGFHFKENVWGVIENDLDEIPNDRFYNITDLIEKIRQKGGRIGVFPVSEKSWTDIGTWGNLLKYYPH